FGASQIGSVNQPSVAVGDNASDSLVAILSRNGKLTPGEHYTITSYVSSADAELLRKILMPADSPHLPPNIEDQYPISYYDPNILSTYTRLPKDLDPQIAILARQITANQPTMYDKVQALETYLRSHFTYDVNIHLQAGEEGV